MQFHFFPYSTDRTDPSLHRFSGFTMSVCKLRPESRGTVEIKSADPSAAPAIQPNFLERESDVATMLDGVKLIRKLAATPALSRWIKRERDPGPGCASDDQIIDFVRNKGFTVYHPVGTCKMGSDPAAVVDQKLRVHGMQNLRVIDASVMPVGHLRQHQCARHHDRGEGRGFDPARRMTGGSTMLPAEYHITGKVVFITGAGRGIGKGIAQVLANAGADIALNALTPKFVEPLAAEIAKASGRRIEPIVADVTNPASVRAAVDSVLAKFGRIDVLVNALGDSVRKPLVKLPDKGDSQAASDDELKFVMDINLTEAILCTRAVGAHMLERRSGKVISISS